MSTAEIRDPNRSDTLQPRTEPLGLRPISPRHRQALEQLARSLKGEVRWDPTHRLLFSTDASLYEVEPVAVAFPARQEDLQTLVQICTEYDLPITARGAGTSLAGQAVGPGLIVDCGRALDRILEVDVEARTVRVEPGVVRDELNRTLARHRLFFAPDTSTSNRCMIGGMIGNNSCGSYSILYGQTRDHVRSLDLVFADGVRERAGATDRRGWQKLGRRDDRFGAGVGVLERLVGEHHAAILAAYPSAAVSRRNTGYPLDDLARTWLGGDDSRDPDLARFFCGTEGTLALVAEATLGLEPLPEARLVLAAHFASLEESLHATVEAVRHRPASVELLDRRLLELARANPEQEKNRSFLVGDPAAVLLVELFGAPEENEDRARDLIRAFASAGLGYAFPVLHPPESRRPIALRTAGLGVLMGAPGDIKPVTLVEDTAVPVADLPAFIGEFTRIMAEHDTDCVYYGHASVGELHLRPELDLKLPEHRARAAAIATEVAELVARFRGALSGEHGDGRLRSPFLPRVLGNEVCSWLEEVKAAFDPQGIFNPGTITRPQPFDESWRFAPGYRQVKIESEFAFEESGGLQRAVERCNGAGVCRQSAATGATMCPSFMATGEERDSTRGRANLFRRLVQLGPQALFSSRELEQALSLCLGCKGCRRDCPASVDMSRLKTEFLNGWHRERGSSAAQRLMADLPRLGARVQRHPLLVRLGSIVQNSLLGRRATALAGLTSQRPLPRIAPRSFFDLWAERQRGVADPLGRVLLFVDEFTNLFDPQIGIAAAELLETGGYEVMTPRLAPSGRTQLSLGFLAEARQAVEENIRLLHPQLAEVEAIVGIEPSAVLTLVDEALDLPRSPELRQMAQEVAARARLVEDFVVEAHRQGRWRGRWREREVHILLHGHCHQKALVGIDGSRDALGLPPGHRVEVIPSGCCGLAGSFGYQAEHYELSLAVGELVLFPALRSAAADTLVAAPGHSCRHQIAHGVKRTALHPVEILRTSIA